MFLFFLVSTFIIQENTTAHDDHTHGEDDGFLYFQPLSTGSVLEHENFVITVPDGVYYANEENVPLMLPLTGADQIPYCVGIFYSNSNNWNYSAVVQHYADNGFNLEPEIKPDVLTTFFKSTHLQRLTPLNGQADVVIPPTYQREENSFTLGMQYTEEDHTLVIVKKIFATTHGALVITYKGNDEAYSAEPEALDKILHSVTLNEQFRDEPSDKGSLSYLQLMGFTPQAIPVESSPENEGIDPKFYIFSAILGLAGIALLAFAFKLRKTTEIQSDP